MKIMDLNGDREKVILLIHPMLSSAEGMKLAIADHMEKNFAILFRIFPRMEKLPKKYICQLKMKVRCCISI